MSPSSVESALATRLRTARQAAGLTQVELAKRVKTDQARLSRIERGEATGRPELLRVIARELKVTVSYLLGEDTSEQAVRPTREAITSDRKMPKGLRDLAGDDSPGFAAVVAPHCAVADALTKVALFAPADDADAAALFVRFGATAHVFSRDTGWRSVGTAP